MNFKEVNILDSYHKWCLGSGYFEGFIRTGPFVSLKYFNDIKLEIPKEKSKNFYEKIEEHINFKDKTLIIIDIDGASAMEIGYKLNINYNLWPVIVFNFLLHPYGVVGDNEFINALIYYGNILKIENIRDVVMILDYNRFGDIGKDHLKETFNNQYELSDEDLPDIEMLSTLGYTKVLYFCENDEKEDIKYYLEHLKNNNIIVENIRLIG